MEKQGDSQDFKKLQDFPDHDYEQIRQKALALQQLLKELPFTKICPVLTVALANEIFNHIEPRAQESVLNDIVDSCKLNLKNWNEEEQRKKNSWKNDTNR